MCRFEILSIRLILSKQNCLLRFASLHNPILSFISPSDYAISGAICYTHLSRHIRTTA